MSERLSARFLHRTLLAGGLALTLLVGAAGAPMVLSPNADAQEIVIAPPQGAPMSFADLIERVRPAVVSIMVRQSPDAAGGPDLEGLPPGFDEFFRGRPGRPGSAPISLGSGFFVDESGIVVTNHHVINGAEEITITTSEGDELPAEIIGSDELTDVAVLRITEPGRFPYVTFDRDSDVRVGDWVVAVGNPFGLDGTATAGIVSAIGRRQGATAYVDYMQIDAPINRGNSGGPTFDLRGRVIGVNSAIFSPTGGNVGIGFAIPSETAARIVDQLMDGGRVSRGWLGVSIQTRLDDDLAHSLGLDEPRGALIAGVAEGGPAEDAGVQVGDVVLSINGADVEDSRDLTRRIGAAPVGANVRLVVLRSGERRTLNVRLGERPSEQVLASNNSLRPEPGASESAPTLGAGQAQNALGVSLRQLTSSDRERYDIDAAQSGLVITAVAETSNLIEKVAPGDVILQAGGQDIRSVDDLATAIATARRAGRPLLLQIASSVGGRRFVAVEVNED